ncbi:MAG: transporter substrate-binding domain-containing protein [Alcanivoracaceae bacterium]|nr:transporter substrate-binding domain-containing protein [Alcanivoracaceae bacterium]
MLNLVSQKYLIHIFLLISSYLFLISPANGLNQWQKIKDKGYLTWITRPSPLTYYTSLDGVIGLEYDILKQFCDSHDIKLTVITAPSNGGLFEMLDGYNIDIAGANLTQTRERLEKYITSIDYDETFISLISSLRKPKIRSIAELTNFKGAILNNSSYEEIADDLINNNISIDSLDGKSLYELLQMVTDGSIDFTLADSNVVAIYKAYIPKLRIGLKLSEMHKLVFLIPYGKDKSNWDVSLKTKLDKFIHQYKLDNKVYEYKQFIVNTLPNSKPADTVYFLKNYAKRWPKVKPLIYSTAEKFNMSPILLGSISYQESHWNAKAISPTLVKGLMMLTKAAAKEQNVTNRLDPLQSLQGGAQYFLKMKDRVPQRITDPDRTNFALAAYNVGYGHLEKARVLTQKAGKNPDLWSDVKLFLPLLNDLDGFKADGRTAVRYVENILVYQNLLQWKEQQ